MNTDFSKLKWSLASRFKERPNEFNLPGKPGLSDKEIDMLVSTVLHFEETTVIEAPPIEQYFTTQLITVINGGKEGGKSVKSTNVLLQWWDLLKAVGRTGTPLVAGNINDVAQIIVFILGGIWLTLDVRKMTTVDFGEKEAAVIYALYCKDGFKNSISRPVALAEIKCLFAHFSWSEPQEGDFDSYLRKLQKVGCIRIEKDESIRLVERTRLKFSV